MAEWDAVNGVWKGDRAVDGAAFEMPEPLWVFGYGSLCWRIDDPCEEKFDGYVTGWRRRMAQSSCDHRGTPQEPGVVATLMSEQEWAAAGLPLQKEAAPVKTHGVVYRVPADNAAAVIDALDFREKGGYTRAVVDAHSLDGSRTVRALVYTANASNPNFIAKHLDQLAPAAHANQIFNAVGPSGPNTEYLFRLADYLRSVNGLDQHIEQLERQVKLLQSAAHEGSAATPTAAVAHDSVLVVVGSKNPVKLEAARLAFSQVFPDAAQLIMKGVAAPSGVPDQPMGDAETSLGARNRAQFALAAALEEEEAGAHGGTRRIFGIGLEGGLRDGHVWGDESSSEPHPLECFAWMAIVEASSSSGGGGGGTDAAAPAHKWGHACTASFALPECVSALVRSGMELGDADDVIFKRTNSKQGDGVVGLLTKGVIDRTQYYVPAIVMALIPFVNPQLYSHI